MNANSTPNAQALTQVLKQLHKAVKDVKSTARTQVAITYSCDGDYPEHMDKYFEASDFLKTQKAIENFKIDRNWEDDVMVMDKHRGAPSPRATAFCEVVYFLTPKVLIDFMVENSWLPKYSLKLSENGELILNDRYALIKVQLGRKNYKFIEYALKHPNKTINAEDMFEEGKRKRFHNIVEELIKDYDLRRVFFPHVKKKGSCKFRNNVMRSDVLKDGIDEKVITKFIKGLNPPQHAIDWSKR